MSEAAMRGDQADRVGLPDDGKVLVVEDDCALREALCDTLAVAGYQVVNATDGLSALSVVDAEKDIAMVLSDVRMPNMDGHQFLSELSARRPELPVVMMTAYGNVDGAVDAMAPQNSASSWTVVGLK